MVSEVCRGVYVIDLNERGLPCWTAGYVVQGREVALIEVGPSSSVGFLLQGLRELSIERESVVHVVVTHVHVDHAGALGTLIKELPNARVVVHQRGAKHVIDPSKLIAGARDFWGAEFYKMGDVEPVSPDKVTPARDMDRIDLGLGRVLRFISSPGHAPHHMCVYEEGSRTLFSGDLLGVVYKPEFSGADQYILCPVTPPPGFDFEDAVESAARLALLDPERICFTHFGVIEQGKEIIERAIGKLSVWVKLARGSWERREAVSMLAKQLYSYVTNASFVPEEPLDEEPQPNEDSRLVWQSQLWRSVKGSALGLIDYLERTGSK